MKTTHITSILCLVFTLTAGIQGWAQAHQASYPSMAPLDQYLMKDRAAEIALARSAAPKSIADNATVLVLDRQGYETAVEGKNGFVCVVERSWMSPANSAEFWNPKLRGPVCFNPPAARSVLPITYKRTKLALSGLSKDEIIAETKKAFEQGELPALEPGGMSYMMSKNAYLTDHGDHNLAHLMIYTPAIKGSDWGADLPDTPVALNQQFIDEQPIDVFIVAIGRWSDGTAAPVM